MSLASITLADECELITKGTTPSTFGLRHQDQGIPFIRAQNLVDGTVSVEADPLFIDQTTHDLLRRSKIKPSDILLSIAGTIGRAAIVPTNAEEMNCNQAVAIIRPSSRIDRRFLLYWLSSRDAVDQISKGKVTGTISNLSLGEIGSLKIVLPPLDKQRRFAAILDQADALRRKRKRALDLLNGFTDSIFLELFGDLKCNTKGWAEVERLGDLADIASGITKGRKLNGEATREVPYLAVSNVQDKFLDLSVVKTIHATENEVQRFRLKLNDLLLTEGGDPDKLGRGTLWTNELCESIHQNHIFRVRVSSPKVTPTYLIWLLGSPYGKAYFLRSAKQTTGIASINKGQLSAFPAILPPMSLQIKFEERAHSVRRALQISSRHLDAIELLFASLQSRAFSGQL
jgi:type I restriction enzyme, S subunit